MVNYTQIIDYLKTKIPNFQSINKRGQVLFTCPNLSKHKFATTQPTMTIINGSDKYYCLSCGLKTTAYGLVRIVENKPNATDEEMISFLTNTLKMDNYPELEIYKKYSWQLFPLAQNSKVPLKGEHWREKEYTSDDKAKWITWIEQGLNLAVNCEFSDTMIIDVDTKEVSPESLVLKDEIIKLLEENKTLVQNTPRFGKHYVFKIDEELCFKQKVDIGGLKIDTRTNKGYFLISPSKINNVSYNWVNLGSEIKTVSQPLKEKLLSLMKIVPEKKEEHTPEIKDEHPIELVSNNLDGSCNNTFVQFGGALLKMGLDSTKIKPILFYLNKHWLKQPMPASAIDGMLNSLGNYKESEETTQEKLIYECCQLLSADISAKDVMEHTGLKRAMIDKILARYHKEGKLSRQGRGRYCIREKVEWVNGNENTMGEIKYNVPYFNDVAYFRQGDIILIGGKTGSGKTIIAINIIKQLKEQGIKPYYVSLEAGCFDTKTEILTNNGWKNYKNISKNDLVLSLNPITNFSTYKNISNIYRYKYNGDIYKYKNQAIDFMLTPNHKILYRSEYEDYYELDRIDNVFKTKNKIRFKKNINLRDLHTRVNKIHIGRLCYRRKLFTEFLAWFISEGNLININNVRGKGYGIQITQRKIKYQGEIKRLLNSMKLNWHLYNKQSFVFYNKDLWQWLKQYCYFSNLPKMRNSYLKDIPDIIMEAKQNDIDLFLETYTKGDGSFRIRKNSKRIRVIYTSQKHIANKLQILFLKLGNCASLRYQILKQKPSGRIAYRIHEIIEPEVQIKKSQLKIINYKGIVWCVNTKPYHLIYVRRNGYCYWTGNSRYEKIASQLGLSNQDFYIPKIQLVNPNQIEIEPNVCTVLDWLYTGEDFTATQAIFKHLNDEMIRKGGLLIVFTQLKEDYSWFAPNLVKSFPRFAARFIYDDEVGIISHFDICKITEPRGQYQTAIIPTEFNFETKQLLKKHNI